MANTILPSQLGFTPTGSSQGSQFFIGRNVNVDWEGVGVGSDGRPDPLDRMYIYFTSGVGDIPIQWGHIDLDVSQFLETIAANPNAPTTGFQLAMRQVLVCDAGVTKNMMIIASQTYPTGSV